MLKLLVSKTFCKKSSTYDVWTSSNKYMFQSLASKTKHKPVVFDVVLFEDDGITK